MKFGVFKLTLATVVTRKTCVIFALLLIVLPLLLPMATPWEEKPQLVEPARAQTAWGLLWLVVLGWVFYQAASFGDKWSTQGILEYFRPLGLNRFSQLFQIWLGVMTPFAGFLALTIGICLLFAMPGDSKEAKMWVVTNFQYALLMILVTAPLALVAIALGTRLNATVAYVITAGLALYGLYGVGYLDFFLSKTGSPFFDLIFVLSPHYHLADLTDRLVFKLGGLPAGAFLNIAGYLLGLAIFAGAISQTLFRVAK